MFAARTNDGYYELGLRTGDLIKQAVEEAMEVEKRDALASMKSIDLTASPSKE